MTQIFSEQVSQLVYTTFPCEAAQHLSYYLDYQVEINEYIELNRLPDELIDARVRQV